MHVMLAQLLAGMFLVEVRKSIDDDPSGNVSINADHHIPSFLSKTEKEYLNGQRSLCA